jgi:hypothetical protein
VHGHSSNEVSVVPDEVTMGITSTERAHVQDTGLYNHRVNATSNFNATSNIVCNDVYMCNLFMPSPSGLLSLQDVFVDIPSYGSVLDVHSTMPSGFLCSNFEKKRFFEW